MEYFLGIDPGQSGGIACLTSSGAVCYAVKMPETERDIWLQIISMGEPESVAIIEHVHSMPKQGVASSFKFGQSYGFLRACLIAGPIPFDQVTPQRWQKAMGCMTKGNKNVSKAKAQQLFPGERITHAVADALLLAEYCRRLRTGMLAA
jgi:crossover junction endodeoxyribonuclease RuvC